MALRKRSGLPEVFIDLNARMTEAGYLATCHGTVNDLRELGLTLNAAVGRRFTFVMPDADLQGHSNDIMFDGTIALDPVWGYLAVADDHGIYWRSDIDDT